MLARGLRAERAAGIAGFRRSAGGTVKTHLNAICRKAGVAGRGRPVSLPVEDPMCAPPLPEACARQAETGQRAAGTYARLWREGRKSV